jgi:pimeloyl-ACP methyl ester carboxylesterase
MKRSIRRFLLISPLVVWMPCLAFAQQPRMISIGDRSLAVYCNGEAVRSPTVILIAGGGRTAKDWSHIQPTVSKFARVCSYDYANLGASDKVPGKFQSVDEVVDDLHAWLKASGEKGPFILAGHSIAGLYARRFVIRYPGETAGLLFVDSSHEEQVLRQHELDPQGLKLDDGPARLGFYVKPGQRLEWRTELPVIVLGRGRPFPRPARDGSDSQTNRMIEEQFAAWDRIWRGFQEDLAKRSKHGELRVAEESGHFIQLDQPELVIQAIRDLTRSR